MRHATPDLILQIDREGLGGTEKGFKHRDRNLEFGKVDMIADSLANPFRQPVLGILQRRAHLGEPLIRPFDLRALALALRLEGCLGSELLLVFAEKRIIFGERDDLEGRRGGALRGRRRRSRRSRGGRRAERLELLAGADESEQKQGDREERNHQIGAGTIGIEFGGVGLIVHRAAPHSVRRHRRDRARPAPSRMRPRRR